jgi:hypothetical protein
MTFDDNSVVARFQVAVECLAGAADFRQRMEFVVQQLEPLQIEQLPPEEAKRFRPVYEGITRGATGDDLTDEKANQLARLIVDISHRLACRYAVTAAAREQQWPEQGSPQQTTATASDARPKVRVLVHTRNPGQNKCEHELRELATVPQVDDHVLMKAGSTAWYKVQLVVHTAFPYECDAEVWAVAVEHVDAQKKAMPDGPWGPT